ncbi:hypothetical protein ACW7BJ_33850 [Azospirillum argentinense]
MTVKQAEAEITKRAVEMVGWILRYREHKETLEPPETSVSIDETRRGGTLSPHRHEWPKQPNTNWGYKLAIRMLGFSLHAVAGNDALVRACDAVTEVHGGRGTSVINSAWDGIGSWVA